MDNEKVITKNLMADLLETAKKYPEKIAVISDGEKISYQQLADRSGAISAALLKNVGEIAKTALIILESDALGVVAILAAMRAGFVYTFLEPDVSAELGREVIEQLDPQILISTTALHEKQNWLPNKLSFLDVERLNAPDQDDLLDSDPALDDTAMVFFLSWGSAKPKGLALSHRVINHRVRENTLSPVLCADDVIALSMSLSFLRSPELMLMAFVNQACIAIYRLQDHTLPDVAEWIAEYGVSIIQMTPDYVSRFVDMVIEHPEYRLQSLRLLSVGGAKLDAAVVKKFQRISHLKMILRFQIGASETSSYYYTDHDRNTKVGDELWFDTVGAGTVVFVRDEDGDLHKTNAIGELFVGSEKLFQKYLYHSAEFTEEPSVPGGKLFATGDIGEIDARGRMRILGRKDAMIKIRGYRMDLTDITKKIELVDRVNEAHTTTAENRRKETYLAAYIAFKPGQECSITKFRAELLKVLEPYKVPTRFMILPTLPRESSGKISKIDLPPIDRSRPMIDSAYASPETAFQQALAEIWQEVLDLDQVGVGDSFFDLGGDSISVLEMMTLAEERLGIKIPTDFIDDPTIMAIQGLLEDSDLQTDHYQKAKEREAKFTQTRSKYFKEKIRKEPLTLIASFFIRRIEYKKIFSALRWLSKNKFVGNVIYRKQRSWFQKWLEQSSVSDPKLAYQKFIFSDLIKYISHAKQYLGVNGFGFNHPDSAEGVAFVGSILSSFHQNPKGAPHPDFPIEGLAYLTEALNSKKPIILVSFHGNVDLNFRELMEYQLGIQAIKAITHNRGEYGKYGEGDQEFDQIQKNSSNASATVDALRYLADGRVIIFYADTNDPMTKNYAVPILGREYFIKGGFAEIAEAVGATIIPMVALISDDLKLERVFYPPMVTDKTNINDRVQDLVSQYAAFMQRIYHTRPEAMDLHKIKRFFERKKI